MKNYGSAVGAMVFGLRLASCAALALCLVQCSAEQPADVAAEENLGSVSQALEHCGGVACTGLPDCTASPPVCVNPATIACPTVVPPTPRECVYSLKISASCPCLEHDVRLCTISGSPGVQICNKVTSTTTAWGSCQTTPACTP